ncbi:MAG: hypothetical protein AB8B51_09455 [Sedimentitalea sp.]
MRVRVLALMVLLAGCAAPSLPVATAPVSFTRAKSDTEPKIVGLDRMTFRSFQGKTEVAGAKCAASNGRLRASFTTPAAVDLPRTQGKTGPLSLVCTLNGKTVSRELPEVLPVASNVNVGITTTSAAGLAAGLIVLAAASGIAQERDIWAYSKGAAVYTVKFD